MCAKDWRIPYLNRLLAELPAYPYPLLPGLSPNLYHLANCTVPVSSTTPDPTQSASKTKRPNREAPLTPMTDQIFNTPRLLLLGKAGTGKSTLLNLLCARLCCTALGKDLQNGNLNIDPELVECLQITVGEPWYALHELLPVHLSVDDFYAKNHSNKNSPPLLMPVAEAITTKLKIIGLDDFIEPMLAELKNQGGILILDDLDKFENPSYDDKIFNNTLVEFGDRYPACHVILAYQTRPELKPFAPPPGYKSVRLATFNDEQIAHFLECWFKPGWLATPLSTKELENKKNNLVEQLAKDIHLKQLGSHPSHLSMLCALLTWQSKPLPACAEHLLISTCQLLQELKPVSLTHIHSSLYNQQQATYLAAKQAYQNEKPGRILKHWQTTPNQGDELLRLVATLAYLDAPSHGWDWIERLCTLNEDSTLTQTAAHLAGNLANRVFPRMGGVLPKTLLQPLQLALLGILQKADLPAQARIETGDDLAMLGDPRFDPYTWYLPRQPMFGFIEIPAGSFWMGTDEREVPAMLEQWGFGPDWVGQAQPIEIMQQWYKREIPQHCLYLDRFFIARYPVTVAQFSCFCKISGHEPDYPDCLEKPANHPVWNVSFRDALAYCHWLEESLQTSPKTPQPIAELLAKGWRLTIPSEAEWEKSARGDCTPPRLYPWGNDFDADKANLSETGLGKTSSVGCFPRGASPYGLLDLCGNVWEWTRSLWGNDPNQPEFGYPYQVEDGREQIVQDETLELRTLRGASCNNYQRYARCATRRAPIPVYHSSLRGFRLAIVR